jgi:acetoin utilization protein AcuB
MTAQPHSIHAGAALEEARALMDGHAIRHLPVMSDRTVIGIISDRDLQLVLGLEGTNPARFVVSDICHRKPYVVEPDTLLREVAGTMAERHIGSAIVMQGEKLLGIFTTVDACRALVSVLDKQPHA